MMDAFRRWCEKILRIPPEPEPPPGDEASARTFRAAPAYLRLLLIVWGISNVAIVFFVTMSMGIGLVVALVETRQQPGAGLIAAFLALVLLMIVVALVFQAVFRYAVIRLEYEKRWYVVTDRSLRVRETVRRAVCGIERHGLELAVRSRVELDRQAFAFGIDFFHGPTIVAQAGTRDRPSATIPAHSPRG